MFGEFRVERFAVRIAKRHIARPSSQAFPNQLHQPQPFFGRKLKDFGDIGFTHEQKLTIDSA